MSVVGCVARSALCLGRMLPADFAWWLGGIIGWFVGGLPARDPRLARTHLRRAWPDRDEKWIASTARRVFRHAGRMALWSLATCHCRARHQCHGIMVEGADNLRATVRASRRGEGTVIFSGHFGNWELLARITGAIAPVALIGKRMRDPDLDALVLAVRQGTPDSLTIYQDEGVMPALRALRQGRLLAALADQDVRRLAMMPVPWFGSPAATPTGPAQLARLSGCAMQPVFCYRRGAHWVVHWGPRRVGVRTKDREADAGQLTVWVTSYFEALVRRHPEQWMWWHRRWRSADAAAAEAANASGLPVPPAAGTLPPS